MDRDDQGKARAATGGARRGPPGKGGDDAQGKPRIRRVPDPRMSRSMEYGLAMLQCFSSESPALGIADIADIIEISRSTTHRYATTLVVLGYLEQDSKRKYRLSRRAAEPGMAAIGAMRLRPPARAILQELRDQTGHTVSAGVLDLPSLRAPERAQAGGERVLYVDRLLAHRAGQHEIDRDLGIGAAIPAHCTALGKALLANLDDLYRTTLLADIELTRHGPNSITQKRKLGAELDRIREEGLALSDEELIAGLRSIAAPVIDPRRGRPIAIDVAVPSSAYTARELLAVIGPRLKRAAELVSAEF